MKKIGISIYPDKTTLEEDEKYLTKAASLGYSRIFTSFLQLEKSKAKESMRRFKETIKRAKELNFEVIVDVHPYFFKVLEISYSDLTYFNDLGVDGFRLDEGFTGKEEAAMTRNPFNLKIEINMSNYNHYLNQILDYNPNKENLIGCHNFYPQAFTALDTEHFIKCSKVFKENQIRSATFVTSQEGKIGPWPLQEGLCTIEEHRYIDIAAQVKHLKIMGITDDIIIGNAYASNDELERAAKVFFSNIDTVSVELLDDVTPLEREIVIGNTHNYRGDYSSYMIRSTRLRMKYTKEKLPSKNEAKDIKRGDILILNESYGQYKAELQIALKDRKKDQRINIVGRIKEDEVILLEHLKIYQDFKLEE